MRKPSLDTVVNLALLVVCFLVVTISLRSYVSQPTGTPRNAAAEMIGKPWPGQRLDTAKRTLVLSLSTGCHFCTESMPFYARLSHSRSPGVRMVALFPEREAADAPRHLAHYGVAVDQIAPHLETVRGTPTLFLLDGKNIVKKAWVGTLSPWGEHEVLQSVSP